MSYERRCENCRHWGRVAETGWEAEEVGFHHCDAIRERWVIEDEGAERYATDGDEWIRQRADALRAARAFVVDGSEYRAGLFTAPDFFCALHELRS